MFLAQCLYTHSWASSKTRSSPTRFGNIFARFPNFSPSATMFRDSWICWISPRRGQFQNCVLLEWRFSHSWNSWSRLMDKGHRGLTGNGKLKRGISLQALSGTSSTKSPKTDNHGVSCSPCLPYASNFQKHPCSLSTRQASSILRKTTCSDQK